VARQGLDAWPFLRTIWRDFFFVTHAPLPGHCACGMAFCFEYFSSGFWQYTTDGEEIKVWCRADYLGYGCYALPFSLLLLSRTFSMS
jgi:hypothetical protein